MNKGYSAERFKTSVGTTYFKRPSAYLISKPDFDPNAAAEFVRSYDGEFDDEDYFDDFYVGFDEHGARKQMLDGGAGLVKFAGQGCYLSFGEKRTRNADAGRYFDNLKEQAHGSVFMHAQYSFVLWGIDRACSHELVRHGTGTAFSQMSQRYVSGKTLRFVERPEYYRSEKLHEKFERWIDLSRNEYDQRAALLTEEMAEQLKDLTPTERRKAVNQAARNCLPNETETAMVMSGNVRAWRNILEQRAAHFADRPINELIMLIGELLKTHAPYFFNDYVCYEKGDRVGLETKWRKI